MLYIDSHVHVGDYNLVKKYVETSMYRDKIRLYSALDSECVKNQKMYLQKCYKYFGIPIILKEIDIFSANDYLEEFALANKECVPVFLVGDNFERYIRNNSIILKEHFLHHKAKDWRDRISSYIYLNDISGYLLIHSSDSSRLEHINMLRKNFHKMKIIIAHMGRDVYENYIFSKNIIDTFKDDNNVLFDTSTIKNMDIIMHAYNTIGDERILFGTDFPYECKPNMNTEMLLEVIKIPYTSKLNMMYYNALRVIE